MNHPNLAVERITNLQELEKLKDDWNRLLANNATQTIELSYNWQTIFWKHFGGLELCALVVRKDDTVVAIAPLKLTSARRFGIRTKRLSFIAAEESNYQDFLVEPNTPEAVEAIASYLADHHHLWDVLDLSHVPENSPTAQTIPANLGELTVCQAPTEEKCIYLSIDRSWDEYAESSKKTRSEISYRMRRLNKMGTVDYFHCADEEQLRFYLEAFFEMHRKRWNQDGRPSQFNDERFRQFYSEISPLLFANDQLDLIVLSVEDQPVAFSYVFRLGKTQLGQLMAYDPDYSAGAPARVLMELFVREAFANSIETIDFGHYYSYKEDWADRLKSRLNVELYPRRPKPLIVYSLSNSVEFLRSRSKQITPLRQAVQFVREKHRALLARGYNRQQEDLD